jgi:uncharacterized repeat protein (TIGR03803 family)
MVTPERTQMTRVTRFHGGFTFVTIVALLSGCAANTGTSQLPIQSDSLRTIASQASLDSPAFQILHKFGGASDGWYPASTLINVKGTLYGTTVRGGAYNAGTVFSISKGGEETVLHSFAGAADGGRPYAPLVNVKGTFYGTTSAGGTNNTGTVFSITPDGTEKVLHSFGSPLGPTDGAVPYAGLINVKGTLYGTTSQGGEYDECPGHLACGTVFSITTSGAEELVYSFGNPSKFAEGFGPVAGLLEFDDALYGTTSEGGTYGRGTVFTVGLYGGGGLVYSFGSNRFFDGTNPSSALIEVGGEMYGTTVNGGAYADGGTVFRVTKGGNEKVIHSFSGSDGARPYAELIDMKGALYGTASQGGANEAGTVFSLTTGGKEKLLHSFGNGSGKHPIAGVFSVGGTLYGTTYGVTAHRSGNVFAITP